MYSSIYKPAKTVVTIVLAIGFVFAAFVGTSHAQMEQNSATCTSDFDNLGLLCAADKLNKALGSYTTYQNAKDTTVIMAVGKPSAGSAMSAQEINKWDLYSSTFESQEKQYYIEANFNQGFFSPVVVREGPFWEAAEPVSLITVELPLQKAIDRMRAGSGCTGAIKEVSLWKKKYDPFSPAVEIMYYLTVMLEAPSTNKKTIRVGTTPPYKVYDKCRVSL